MDEISLSGNRIKSAGISTLFDALKATNSPIQELNLSFNSCIDDDCMKSLGEYIKCNKTIRALNISYCAITDTGIDMLIPYLDDNTTFKELNINGNERITKSVIPSLLKMIEVSHIDDLKVDKSFKEKTKEITLCLALNQIKRDSSQLTLFQRYV